MVKKMVKKKYLTREYRFIKEIARLKIDNEVKNRLKKIQSFFYTNTICIVYPLFLSQYIVLKN